MITKSDILNVFGTVWQDNGNEYKVTCPKCGVKALWVNTAKYVYHCFSCSDGGRLSLLVAGWKTPPDMEEKPNAWPVVHAACLPDGYRLAEYYDDFPEGWRYLIARGVNPTKVEWGFTPARDSVVFPMREDGDVIYWQSRSIYPVIKQKTRNPKGTSKSSVVYRVDTIDDVCIVVEGIFDALRVEGVATLGKICSLTQAYKILSRRPKAIFVCYDDDAFMASVGTAGMLQEMDRTIPSVPVQLIGNDPAALGWVLVLDRILATLSLRRESFSLCGVDVALIEKCLRQRQLGIPL